MPNIYQDNGYKDRADYLDALAADFDLPAEVVQAAADILGPSEDFDGLITSLEDFESIGSEFTQDFDDFTDADPGL